LPFPKIIDTVMFRIKSYHRHSPLLAEFFIVGFYALTFVLKFGFINSYPISQASEAMIVKFSILVNFESGSEGDVSLVHSLAK
jgi:hypothetical protein